MDKKLIDLLNKDIGPRTISPRIMSLFLKELSLVLGAGISLKEGLKIIKDESIDKKLTKALDIIIKSLDKGLTSYESFTMAKAYFSPLILALIKTGDETGKLRQILADLSDFIFEDSKNKNIIKQALSYPILVFCVTIMVTIAIINFVMPSFIEIFDRSEKILPLPTRILIGISKFLGNYTIELILVFIIIFLLIAFLRSDPKKKIKMDELSFKFAPFKRLKNLYLGYQLTSIYYILRKGGISDVACFDIIKVAFKNTYIKERIISIKNDLNRGHSLSESFERSGIFSNLLISMVKVGQNSGKLEESLKKANEYYRDEYIFRIKNLAKLSEPILILIMSLLVAFVVFSVSVPMFDAVNFGSL